MLVEVEATDVVRLVLQFLKESSLSRSLQTLQDEAQVALSTVDNVDSLITDVQQGNWQSVMSVVAMLKLPFPLLANLYEQLVLELLELRELDAARQVLRSADPMVRLRTTDSLRFANLEGLVGKPYFDPRDAYPHGSGKEAQRARARSLGGATAAAAAF